MKTNKLIKPILLFIVTVVGALLASLTAGDITLSSIAVALVSGLVAIGVIKATPETTTVTRAPSASTLPVGVEYEVADGAPSTAYPTSRDLLVSIQNTRLDTLTSLSHIQSGQMALLSLLSPAPEPDVVNPLAPANPETEDHGRSTPTERVE